MIDETDLFDRQPDEGPVFCEEGTVGYPGDPDPIDLGTGSTDGMTLVKVTLFRGHPPRAPRADDGLANGYRIAARLGGPVWYAPKRGQRVVVVFPGGDMLTPGNGVIVATPITSPTTRFGRKKTVLDFGTDDVVITGKSVSLVAEEGEGASAHRHVVSVSGNGGAQVVSDGSGLFVKDGEVTAKTVDGDGNLMTSWVLDQEDVTLCRAVDPASPVTFTLTAQGPEMVGQFITCEFKTAMKLGAAASPATPVLLGMSGPSGIPSTCIWGAVAPA